MTFTQGYFRDVRQIRLPDVFPPFLRSEVSKNHGVVACEGSMFKSKFANALTTMMIGALGIAAVQNKLSVGYGAEAGQMDPLVEKMCKHYCRESLVITRNIESQDVLGKLGIATELGTDTAWTFEPLGPEYGRKALRDAGWDGTTPVLAVCPINPFWKIQNLRSRNGPLAGSRAPTRKATTARSISIARARTWMLLTKSIFRKLLKVV